MTCVPAPACKAVLAQATARWPSRSRRSDGICPSAAHSAANPTSDHEPGNAVDLTHDPAHGCDAHAWARALADRRDRRVAYIISDRQIWEPDRGWRRYTGTNPHTTHTHVSIWPQFRGDAAPWFDAPTPPLPTPTTWEADVPKPTDFTSACVDPVTGGHWEQTAEGGIDGHDGARNLGSYKDHPDLGGGVRYFTAIIASGKGGYVQISNDGKRYQWDPKP